MSYSRPEVRAKGRPRFGKVDPFTRHEYQIWRDQYEQDRARGINRKLLPIGALQKYIKFQRASYIAQGGDSESFKDQFDRVDIASASDSWRDLDGELEKNHIYGGASSKNEYAEIRRQQKEEREISKGYDEFVKSLGKKQSAG